MVGQAQVDPPDPHLFHADHLASRVRRLLPLLRPTIAPRGPLHHLAQCSDAGLDFALTAVTPRPDPAGPAPLPVRSPADFAVVDQELSITAARLDQRLAPVRSGHLIRLVAQAASGAFICDLVLPGRYLLGGVFTAPHDPDALDTFDAYDVQPDRIEAGLAEVDRADQEVARLTDTVRGQLNQPTLNAGAYRDDSDDSGPLTAGEPHVWGDDRHPLVPAHTRVLALDGLHYLAHYEDGALSFSIDLLADPGLDDYAELIHPSARRRFYQELGAEFEPLAAELGRVLLPVIPDQLVRIVLDVELGAIYCFRLGPDAYLLGVTLKQRRVEAADIALRGLVSGLVAGPPR